MRLTRVSRLLKLMCILTLAAVCLDGCSSTSSVPSSQVGATSARPESPSVASLLLSDGEASLVRNDIRDLPPYGLAVADEAAFRNVYKGNVRRWSDTDSIGAIGKAPTVEGEEAMVQYLDSERGRRDVLGCWSTGAPLVLDITAAYYGGSSFLVQTILKFGSADDSTRFIGAQANPNDHLVADWDDRSAVFTLGDIEKAGYSTVRPACGRRDADLLEPCRTIPNCLRVDDDGSWWIIARSGPWVVMMEGNGLSAEKEPLMMVALGKARL